MINKQIIESIVIIIINQGNDRDLMMINQPITNSNNNLNQV